MAFCFSRPASIRLWYGRITCAFSLTTSWLGSESSPRLRSRSISSSSASGSTTTPFPMMHFLPGCRIPLGTRCSTVFTPPTTSVCPALAPPWYRTTTSAQEVKRSTTFPFPSSPHCAPTITTLDMVISLSRRRAATVRGVCHALAQFRVILGGLEDALDVAAGGAEEQRDGPAVGDELPARGEPGRLSGDHPHFLGGVEQQPLLRPGLPLPGAHQPGDVRAVARNRRLDLPRVGHGARDGRVRLRLAARAAERGGERQDGRDPQRVTWTTLRTLGRPRRRSSTSAGAAPSTFTSASASPLLRSRASANWAMFTCASPRVRPTFPITPGLSSLCSTRIAPSGTASSSNLSTRTTRGSRLPTMVPATSVLPPLAQRRRTETRLEKSGVSLVFTSFTESPRSRARAGAETSFTGSARKLPRTPLSTAAVSGAVGCCETSPAYAISICSGAPQTPCIESCPAKVPSFSASLRKGPRRSSTSPLTEGTLTALRTVPVERYSTIASQEISGWSAAGGSVSNTSRAAPPRRFDFKASASAFSSTSPPRAQLIRSAPRFICAICCAPTMFFVCSLSGTCSVMASLRRKISGSCTSSTPRFAAASSLRNGS